MNEHDELILVAAEILAGNRAPLGFYRKSRNRRAVIRHLVEKILNRKDEDRFTLLSIQDFKTHHLYGLLTTYYRGSPRRALEEAYQEELKSYNVFQDPELILRKFFAGKISEPPRNFWNQDLNRLKTLIWFVEKHLQLSPQEIYSISTQDFITAGLGGFLSHYYGCSPVKALMAAYPCAKTYRFTRVDKKIWQDPAIRLAAVYDLLEAHQIPPAQLPTMSMNQLIKLGLKHSLARYYFGNIRELTRDLGPQLLSRNH